MLHVISVTSILTLVLQGKNEQVLQRMGEKMQQASEAMAYELAARYRDQLQRLQALQAQQSVWL